MYTLSFLTYNQIIRPTPEQWNEKYKHDMMCSEVSSGTRANIYFFLHVFWFVFNVGEAFFFSFVCERCSTPHCQLLYKE